MADHGGVRREVRALDPQVEKIEWSKLTDARNPLTEKAPGPTSKLGRSQLAEWVAVQSEIGRVLINCPVVSAFGQTGH